ncbi:MAG: DUF5668 domain-containing protein, partial [Bryobacteraceae bacterium]
MSSEAKIVGYCRACGKALDEGSVRAAQGTIYCEEHVPMSTGTPTTTAPGQSLTTVDVSPYTASPYTSATPPPIPNPDVSPGLAFGLGFIPGVGAIYNGQYAKGLVHAIMVGLIISILDSAPGNLEPLLAFLMVGFWIYMPFEAYHTAKRRQQGEPVDEFSSLIPTKPGASRIPVAPLVLIAIGVIFLLDNLNILQLRVLLHYWPVLLIVAGVYMLYSRVRGAEGGGR